MPVLDCAVRVRRGAPVPAGPSPRVSRAWVLAFGLVIGVTYFATIGRYALAEPDEPRYAEIPREMIELGDWLTPHLNYVKYFEKPPLVYWLTAISFEAFGIHEWTARLWPALFGLVGIVMASVLGRAMFDAWTGYAAAALLAAAPFYFGLSQILVLDIPVSALMTVALGCVWLAYTGVHRQRFMVLAYAATALAVLTKGPVVVLLTGAIVMLFVMLQRDIDALRWLCAPLGVLVFVGIALPWFVLVSAHNPEFLNFFIINQHIDRMLRTNEHKQPLWFFVPIVVGGFLPWSAFVLLAPRLAACFLRQAARLRLPPAVLYCVIWSAVVFGFFSLSRSKLGTYVLPMFCPLAILLARFFRSVIDRNDMRTLVRGCIAMLVLAAAALIGAVIAPVVADDPVVGQVVPSVYAAAVILALTAASALVTVRRGNLQTAFAILLMGVLVLQGVAITGRRVATQYRTLGMAIGHLARPQDQVITYQEYVQAIAFYARHRVIVVGGGRGELKFGSLQGDQHEFFWDDNEALLHAWKSPRHIFLVINREDLDLLKTRLQPAPRQIAAQDKKVVVVNFN
jgi:4-amino-4-deoxy-L-arabinose transferase-like glycosyltransferase